MDVKNIGTGVLIVADAGLKLLPGESATVDETTKQLESALKAGLIVQTGRKAKKKGPESARTTEEKEAKEEPPQESGEPTLPFGGEDLTKLSASDAIAAVKRIDDSAQIETLLEAEKRSSVRAELNRKKRELRRGAS